MRGLIRNAYNNRTLRDKILLLNVLMIVFVLSVLAYFANHISSGIIIDKTEQSAVRELELIDSNLFTLIRSIEDYSKVVASNNRVQELLGELADRIDGGGQAEGVTDVLSMRPEMYAALANVISPNTPIFAASIFIDNQEIYSDRMIDSASIRSIADEKFLEEASISQKPTWSDLLKLRRNDGREENVFAVAKLVIDLNTGRKLGVVVLFIDEQTISGIFSENRSSTDSKQYIVKDGGRIISAENKGDLNRQVRDVVHIRADQFERLGRENKVILSRQGEKSLLSMQEFQKIDWRIVSLVPMHEIAKDETIIRRLILIVGALCLAFAFVSSYYISNTVTMPIRKLAAIMKKIRQGDMDVRAEPASNHELGMLTRGFNSLMDRIQELLKEVVTEQKAKQAFEFKLIQSQLNPHFLYNSLETILSLNKLERYEEAMQVTRTLADFYRRSLSGGRDIVPIRDEIRIIRDYLQIQKRRYANYMDFSLDVEEDIMDDSVPKLTLQPLVENAIYHGLKSRGNRGKIAIRGYRDGDRIVLEVFDDGIGIPEEKAALLLHGEPRDGKSGGFGLSSVDRRIKLLFGPEYGLRIASEIGSFTQVSVTIPAFKTEG
ncbi:sensor histidine kinase [Cohnella zeiphila]|uniref:histidine kinase n=1 Tax=Cohnella zeiphila TaxID=2761120 RepID=A0A7X0VXE8_9BACL|nr:sensor histidine kinase [Cohnella zeiphila]MBB6731858.1 sensor histidine kinase [Cohnella zeiphila]